METQYEPWEPGWETTSWEPVLEKIEQNFKRWNMCNPSLDSKHLIVQMIIGGMTQFLTNAQGMPKSIETAITKEIRTFIWNECRSPPISLTRLEHCRDSILYRLVLAYFTAHDDWASQHNITIMCRVIPHIMCSFPAIIHQTQDTFLHSCNAFPRSRLAHVLMHLCISSCIIAFHRASLRFIMHHHVPSHIIAFLRIFAFHCTSSDSIAI
jgi:hypothetical protein